MSQMKNYNPNNEKKILLTRLNFVLINIKMEETKQNYINILVFFCFY